jgi:hypothetical protein
VSGCWFVATDLLAVPQTGAAEMDRGCIQRHKGLAAMRELARLQASSVLRLLGCHLLHSSWCGWRNCFVHNVGETFAGYALVAAAIEYGGSAGQCLQM